MQTQTIQPSSTAVASDTAGCMARKLLSVAEAEKLLGVCRKTVYNLTKDGELRAVRVRGRVLYDPADIDTYIENSKTK